MGFVVLTNYCYLFHLPFKPSLSSSSSCLSLSPCSSIFDMDNSKAEGKRSMKDRMKEDVVKEDEEDEDAEEDNKKKRAMTHSGRKVSGGGSATLCCQVEDCMADMSDAKAYHRRHKVCEIHARAPVVRMGGLQQRFCQQCSRFHELSEFDDAKKSCRNRLLGHNERRRKSSYDFQGDGSG